MTFDWHEEAEAEFVESAAYYEQESEGLGSQFRDALSGAFDRIASAPDTPRQFDRPFRKVRFKNFPYAIVYRITDERDRASGIQIIAVMNLHRKPGYWKSRSFS